MLPMISAVYRYLQSVGRYMYNGGFFYMRYRALSILEVELEVE